MKEKMKKIYLAIPYSQIEAESSCKQANEASIIILNKGFNVFSPITHCHPLTLVEGYSLPGTWDFWSQIDYQFIDWADEVWVCIPKEGESPVRRSVGITAEVKYAKKLGLPVKYFKIENKNLKFIDWNESR